MTRDANYSCFLGAEGWEHAHWLTRFYPDDLPPEWRLTFYSNFFNCTSLGYSAWGEAPLEELERWIRDTGESFRLVLEAPQRDLTAQDKTRLDILRPRIGLMCNQSGQTLATPWSGDGERVHLTGPTDLKLLAGKLQADASFPHPLYLIVSDANISELEKLKTLLSLLGLA